MIDFGGFVVESDPEVLAQRAKAMFNGEDITKDKGMGLTDSWNRAFVEFKNRWFVNDVGMDDNYDYLILSNNDVLVPKGAVTEIKKTFSKWPFSLIVPMSTEYGAGHNRQQGIEYYYPKFGFVPAAPYQLDWPGFVELERLQFLELQQGALAALQPPLRVRAINA